MQARLLIALAALIFATPVIAAPPARDDKPPKKVARKPARKKKVPRGLAFKALRTVIDNATFKEMTFEEFTEWLARQTEANVVVKWKIIEEAGIETDKLINLKLRKVTIRQIIELVFEQVTGELEFVELAAKADDNTLIISTKRDLYTELVIRTYDVQDLLIAVPHFKSIGAQMAQELMNLITSHVEPKSWAVNGGKGTIAFFRGKLVIRNNLIVHELIGGPPKQKSAPRTLDAK